MANDNELIARIEALEVTQSYQEDTIESLEKTVANQHQDIQLLQTQIRLLSDYIKTMRQDGIRKPEEETPPPHY